TRSARAYVACAHSVQVVSLWETATVTDLYLPGLPFPLESSGTPACEAVVADGTLALTCGPKSDMFIDPVGDEGARPDAGRLTGLPGDQDFTFAARVTVKFGEALGARVGFLAQSPLGHGCTAIFDSISFQVGAPANLRDGS